MAQTDKSEYTNTWLYNIKCHMNNMTLPSYGA